MLRIRLFTLSILTALATATPAYAQLPDGARQMIDAALASGDDTKIATVLELARTTWPDEAGEIALIESEWQAAKAERAAAAAKAEKEAIRSAGLLDRWSGEGELGGFQSSGNSDTVGISAGLKLKREGIDWSHRLRARFDYQRQNSVTSREQLLAAYEPRWQFGENVFAYGLAQYERDQIQGVDARYAISGGLGYKVFDREGLSLSVKAGPAYRVTKYTDGRSESRLAGLTGFDFDWQIFERLTLTQDANAVAETGGEALVIVDGSNTTLNLITGLDFKVSDSLRARMSYQFDYDSNPPAGKVSTDTLTRATLIYGF
jgi:putative salt-induced outer membrane protein